MENTTPPASQPSNQPPALPSSPGTENSLAVLMHLLGFAWFFFPFFGNILAPLVLWLVKRGSSPYLDRVGKEVLNFQISFSIYLSVTVAVGTVLLILLIGVFFYFLAAVIWVVWAVLMIIGAVRTSNGEEYRYPFTIRILQ